MGEIGYVNITESKFAIPANPWARGHEQKLRGALMMTNLLEVCQGVTMNVFTKIHGWSPEEVEVFLADVRAGLKDKRIHGYVPACVHCPALLRKKTTNAHLTPFILASLSTPRNRHKLHVC